MIEGTNEKIFRICKKFVNEEKAIRLQTRTIILRSSLVQVLRLLVKLKKKRKKKKMTLPSKKTYAHKTWLLIYIHIYIYVYIIYIYIIYDGRNVPYGVPIF